MFEPTTVGDPEVRSLLSRRADDAFIDAAQRSPDAILVSFWRRPELSTTAGTPTDWLSTDPTLVELQCNCSVDTAVHRFVTRSRHPGHADVARTPAMLTEQFAALAALGPLGLGQLLEVDTEHPVDMGDVVTALGASRRT